VLLAALGWLAAVSHALFLTYSAASDGTDALETVKDVTPGQLMAGHGMRALHSARRDFARANGRMDAWYVRSARFVPIVGRQVRSAEALTGAAVTVLDTGIEAVDGAKARVEQARAGGSARVRALEGVSGIARRAGARLDAVDLGPSFGLVTPLHRARSKVAEQLDELDDGIGKLETAASGVARFLDGPSTYLLLAGNNNEMRIGSGTFLTAGILRVRHGEISLGETVSTANLQITAPGRAPALPADQDRMWGWLSPTHEWRNLASSPRFDVTGALAARMAAVQAGPLGLAPGTEVDGVLAVDPFALRAIVAAVGSVDYRGRRLRAADVLPELLVGQYQGISGYDDPQIERRENLGDLARAALDALDSGTWKTDVLLDRLGDAAAGRHALAWSRHPDQQAAWRAAGIDGALDDRSLLVGVHNRGGNKLDTWLKMFGRITTFRKPGGTDVEVVLTLRNETPVTDPPLPQYVQGPNPNAVGGGPGVYQGIVVVQVPKAASGLRIVGGQRLVGYGDDGPNRVMAVYVKVDRGHSEQVRALFHLPSGIRAMTLQPSARAEPIHWRYAGLHLDDDAAHELEW
jgi:hypothetical protein